MTDEMRAAIAAAQAQEALLALQPPPLPAADAPTDERARFEAARADYAAEAGRLRDAARTAMTAHREALEAAASAPTPTGMSAELRELISLEDRSHVRAAISQALGDEPAEGAENELRQAYELPKTHIPISLLLERPSARAQVEKHAQVATPTTVAAYQQQIVGRVFSAGALAWLGITPRMIERGKALHLIISDAAAAVPAIKAKGADTDFPASVLKPVELDPKRLTVGYDIAKEDLMMIDGAESALRADLGNAMTDRLDYVALRGGGGIAGFLGAGGLDAGAIYGPRETFDSAAAKIAAALDGQYARDIGQVRGAASPAAARRLATQFRGDGNMSVDGWLRDLGGGIMASANMPDPAARAAASNLLLNGAAVAGATVLTVDGVAGLAAAATYAVGDALTIDGVSGVYDLRAKTDAQITIARVDDGSGAGLAGAGADDAAIRRAATEHAEVILAKTGPGAPENYALDLWQGIMVGRAGASDSQMLAAGSIRLVFDAFMNARPLRPGGFRRVSINV